MSLRIVFMGTPEFAVASLNALCKSKHNVVSVVTMPDKPAGRGQKIKFSEVKQFAIANNLPLLQPEKLKDNDFVEALKALSADVFVVVAFRMLPEMVWTIPSKGTINLHGSLLPQYRGAAPINHAIMDGCTETGVTTFFIEKEIDTGKILFSEKINIGPNDNAGAIHDQLMEVGAKLVVETVNAIETGKAVGKSQQQLLLDQILRTAPKLTKENCRINWHENAEKIHNKIRGLSPYPAAWTTILHTDGTSQNLKIFDSAPADNQKTGLPGTIECNGKNNLKVQTSMGMIEVLSLQVEGKKRLATEEFLRGFHGIENITFC